jgi:CubicO group peptidase (beta-lactamase class C family)
MKKRLFVFILSACIIGASCSEQKNMNRKISAISPPQQTDDGWQTVSLTSVGIDADKLQKMVDQICDSTYQGIHSTLIIKDGKLVFEQYFNGYTFNYNAKDFKGQFTKFTLNTIHNLASVTKSVTSVLFGIAGDQGFIDTIDDKLFNFFPQYASLNDSMKSQITLQHLLTMTSGIMWNEQDVFYSEVENDIIQLFIVADPVRYILSKPVIHKPGSTYYYNGGNTNLLGEVIQETSKLKLDDFAKKYLFDPLGINQYQWIHINPDMVYASGDLKLRPRDMAKLGYLMLNDGVWKAKQILSTKWIENSTKSYVHFNNKAGYGYQWWIKIYELGNVSIHSFAANGWGGQKIMVLPGLDAVVVFTAGNYATKNPIDEIIYRYILPSLDKNFQYDYEKIKNEAPISESIKIIKPSNNVSNKIAKLSGHWYGRGDYSIADQLVVEEIDSTEASVLYSWGTHPNGYFENGWVRRTAKVDSTGKIKFTLNSATLTFELDNNEDVLIGYYKNGNALSKLIMSRL